MCPPTPKIPAAQPLAPPPPPPAPPPPPIDNGTIGQNSGATNNSVNRTGRSSLVIPLQNVGGVTASTGLNVPS